MSPGRRGDRVAALLVASALAACAADSPATSVAARNYDRRCVSAADCAAVYEGHVGCCGAADCANTAIARSAAARYDTDLNLAASCGAGQPPCPTIDIIRPGECQGSVACDDGVCAFHQPQSDAATDE